MTTSGTAAPPGTRCAAHPVRRAVDLCPVCERPRCAADATGEGCPACGGRPAPASLAPSAPDLERTVRSALAASVAALLGGVVAAQYVDAGLFAYLTPLVVGVLVAAAAQSAHGLPRTPSAAQRVRLVALVYALLGVALGFVLEESKSPVDGGTLLPYAAAVAGVVLWTLPPKKPAASDNPD